MIRSDIFTDAILVFIVIAFFSNYPVTLTIISMYQNKYNNELNYFKGKSTFDLIKKVTAAIISISSFD